MARTRIKTKKQANYNKGKNSKRNRQDQNSIRTEDFFFLSWNG